MRTEVEQDPLAPPCNFLPGAIALETSAKPIEVGFKLANLSKDATGPFTLCKKFLEGEEIRVEPAVLVGRDDERRIMRPRKVDQLGGLGGVKHERLFDDHVLPRRERCLAADVVSASNVTLATQADGVVLTFA